MDRELDLADIQGNILQDFVSGFPAARFVLLRVADADQGRAFVRAYRSKVTTALRWATSNAFVQKIQATRPIVAINMGFTYAGFVALGLPTRTLSRLPPEFIDGMKKRAAILGDDLAAKDIFIGMQPKRAELPVQPGADSKAPAAVNADPPAVQRWDAVWRGEQAHIIIGLNTTLGDDGKPVAALQTETNALLALCKTYGLQVLDGHGPNNVPWQDGSALLRKSKATYKPVPLEHFGFIDGISNPVFDGQYGSPFADQMMAVGNGKLGETKPKSPDESRWSAFATGEFLLGYPDEAQEIADMAAPNEILRNGTFMVYRKLHENVGSFNGYFAKTAAIYAKANGVSADDAALILKAKLAGRWPDGVPVAVAPTIATWQAFNAEHAGKDQDAPYTDFTYADDPNGAKCPAASHMRRTNTRDSLNGRSSVLNNRRRILRRGVPYGQTTDDDSGEHGIIFIAMCADIARQFEFVQQQWINYGLDSNAGSDTCPLVGNRRGDSKFIVPVDPAGSGTPFIAADIPQFVETRGGDYFFLPSMTALRMIGMGTIDPT